MKTPRLSPGEVLLLVVDIQEKLIPSLWRGARFLHRAELGVRAAKVLGLSILATEQNPSGLGPTVPRIARLLEGAETLPKECFSALRSHDVQARMQTMRKTQLMIMGIEAHICVSQTALDALDTGLETFVLMDAVTSAREEDRRWGTERMVQAGAVPITVQSMAYELLRESGTPDFKAMLPLLKEIAAPDPE